MFLITTADQRFWKTDEKILFLGDWCKVFGYEKVWSSLDYEVLPYHWNDRSKLYEDYKYLNELYEGVLQELADELNYLHNVRFSVRYWRLVVGPWLYYFVQILYDRYLSVRAAIESGKVTSTWLPSVSDSDLVPHNFICFSNWFVGDEYNLFLYSKLIKKIGGLSYESKNLPLKLENSEIEDPSSKSTLLKFASKVSRVIPDYFNKIVFITSYIKPKDLFRLQLSLGQMPYFFMDEQKLKPQGIKESMRDQINIRIGRNQFEFLLGDLISRQIPKVYVEGYLNTVKTGRRVYPKKPKIIFTSNALFGNESFKVWAGDKIEQGVKLVGTQHGGGYGMMLWCSNEMHETKVADRYFSWGWKRRGNQNIVPLASARLRWGKNKIKFNSVGKILWTGFSIPRYSYWLCSSPIGPQYLDHINDQKEFLKSVFPEVRMLLLQRMYPSERGWNEFHMWKYLDPSLNVYRGGSKSSFDQLNESRLSVCTYNGMGVLETLSANFPTIIFWNPKHWELSKSAKIVFDELLKVGIFHENPQSAATKVNQIYQNVQSWWMSEEIQNARKSFCNHFANTSEPLVRLRKELLQLL